jgi:hypothetical protein
MKLLRSISEKVKQNASKKNSSNEPLFGNRLNRCTWKSWKGFCRYVWSSIVAYNPQVMARIKLAAA